MMRNLTTANDNLVEDDLLAASVRINLHVRMSHPVADRAA